MTTTSPSCKPSRVRRNPRGSRSASARKLNGAPPRDEDALHIATGHLLTALYSLSNHVALTSAESERIASRPAFTPAVWCETKAFFKAADRGASGTELSVGFLPDVFAWLGVSSGEEFSELYGISASHAIAQDRGRLFAAACALDGAGKGPLPLALTHAWSARAARLMDALPGTAQAVLFSFELALDGCRWEPERVRPLFEAIAHVAAMVDDPVRLSCARKMLERIDRERQDDTTPDEPERLPLAVVAQVLTALWCLTHDGLLLEEERVLLPGNSGYADAWALIADAARDGRGVNDMPVPVPLLKAWGAPEDLDEEAGRDCVRRCAPLLPQIVAEVARLWGGGDRADMDVFEEVARAVAGIALVRHQGLYAGWDPLLCERNAIIYLEVHQGAQRPRTVARADLIRRLRSVLLRVSADPLIVATAHLDAAAESSAEGKHRQTRSHLDKAMHCTERCEDPVRRAYGAVSVAHHTWLEGNADEAMRRLRALDAPQAQNLLRTIEAHAQERKALRWAEEAYAEQGDVDSMCARVWSCVHAGEFLHAEVTARDGLEQYPDDPKAWHVVACLLFATAHYRHALVPALEALDKGIGRTVGISLLARIFAHLGSEWTEESARLAAQAIEAKDPRELLSSDVLAELAEIVQYHGTDIAPARIADDLVLDMAGEDPPPVEWLGAAAARACHAVFSPEAPAWLARLVDTIPIAPAALARFVVDRAEVLLWWRSKLQDQVDAHAHVRRTKCDPDWIDDPDPAFIREEAIGFALRAAISLGYAEPVVDEGDEGNAGEIEPALHWEPHLATIGAFDELVVRFRASELAQAQWFAAGELGERELLLVLATFDHERVALIRWAAESEAIADLDAHVGIPPATRFRLQRVFEAAEFVDDENIRDAGWITRWQETHPC